MEPLGIAKLLKAVIAEENPDLVILGKQAIDGDNNQTGQMLAALLGWPQGTFASALDFADDKLQVTREIDGGLQTVKLTTPGRGDDRSAVERAALCVAAEHNESEKEAYRRKNDRRLRCGRRPAT